MRNVLPCFVGAVLVAFPASLFAAELAILNEANWDDFAPQGKEADCIYGDFVLRNDQLIAAIGETVPTRNANMRIREVGGCLIDLTERARPNDQFGALYPAPGRRLKLHGVRVDGQEVELAPGVDASGETIDLVFDATPPEGQSGAACRVIYRLADGDEGLSIIDEFSNAGDAPVTVHFEDAVRVDGEVKSGVDADQNIYWANDVFWRQAYCLLPEGRPIALIEPRDQRSGPVLRYGESEGVVELAPGATATFARRVFPADNELTARAKALRFAGRRLRTITLAVRDAAGPVTEATVAVRQGDAVFGVARTDINGKLSMALLPGQYEATAHDQARGETKLQFDADAAAAVELQLPPCGYVAGTITDEAGAPIACKVDLAGVDGAPSPDFGPDSAIFGVRNLVYTSDGKFRVEVRPGKYSVIISHGPEFDAILQELVVVAGQETPLTAQLARTVDTKGWISADFHSHSSPSGDNAASQRGRVLNLLAEHLEFAPCTEHNRITNYQPHLRALNALDRMATCPGMELTGQPLPLNHQNSFPLIEHIHTQDGGGPTTHPDPVVQIERLALWDDGSDKLVQTNHPNIVQMLGDKDLDGQPDGGFERMFGFMDVIEVHPPEHIFTPPAAQPTRRNPDDFGNKIFNWMQLLNLGYRVPGVVNTDAHWNFHGSGWLRNYIRSSTDDPAKVEIMDLVHASEHGHIVMTNGPFLEVQATASELESSPPAEVGDDLAAPDGAVQLHIRVQCPSWLDVNRVQIFVNGRPDEQLNFTRRTHAAMFGKGAVKFDQMVPLDLPSDAHVIVTAAGEGATLGRVYGPDSGGVMPVAVANPIFVDVDGNGFKPNGDGLGLPLPVRPDAHEGAPASSSGG